MSRASVELVRIAMQAYGGGDYEIALALSDPMVRWDDRAARPDGELVWGHPDVLRAMRSRLRDWEDYSFRLEELVDGGSMGVISVYREQGRKAETDVPLDERHAAHWTIEAGKITAVAVYLTKEEAVRAARSVAAERAAEAAEAPG